MSIRLRKIIPAAPSPFRNPCPIVYCIVDKKIFFSSVEASGRFSHSTSSEANASEIVEAICREHPFILPRGKEGYMFFDVNTARGYPDAGESFISIDHLLFVDTNRIVQNNILVRGKHYRLSQIEPEDPDLIPEEVISVFLRFAYNQAPE